MKKMLLNLGILAIIFANYAAQAEPDVVPRIDIKWLGGPSMLIRFNDFQILTDPMFGSGEQAFLMGDPNEIFDLNKGPNIKYHQRLTNFSETELNKIDFSEIDLVVLSHAHEDHFDQAAEKQLNKMKPMLIPSADLQKMQEKGFKALKQLSWGKSVTYKAGDGEVSLTAIAAHHSADAGMDKILGAGNGYWIKFKQDDWLRTIYWTGDTLPGDDVIAQVKNLGRPDVLIPHMGRVGTTGPLGQISMGADEVIEMALKISPKKVLPIHHSTYALYLEPIDHLVTKAQNKPYGLDLISEGSMVIYD